MKRLFLIFITAMFFLSSCSQSDQSGQSDQSNQFQVTLNLDNADNQTVYLVKTVDGKDVIIDSALLSGQTVVMTVDNDDPQIAYIIKFDKNDKCGVFPFFTENQNTTITGDINDMMHWTVKGCPTMEICYAYQLEMMKYGDPIIALYSEMEEAGMEDDTKKIAELDAQIQELTDAYDKFRFDYIKSHPDSYFAHYLLDQEKELLDFEQVKELAACFTTESLYSKSVKEYIQQKERL